MFLVKKKDELYFSVTGNSDVYKLLSQHRIIFLLICLWEHSVSIIIKQAQCQLSRVENVVCEDM